MTATFSIISTKGGGGKTTGTANLGAYLADLGLRVLMVDLDTTQPTLSSYFPLSYQAPNGIVELVQGRTENVISHTDIEGLDLIIANDQYGQLLNVVINAPDGRVRLRRLLPPIAQGYDVVLIDTMGSKNALVDMAVLASDHCITPIPPEMLSAREFARGTLALLDGLRPLEFQGIKVPNITAYLNRVGNDTDSTEISRLLREQFEESEHIHLAQTVIPDLVAYREAASRRIPAHRHELKRPYGRKAPSAFETLRDLSAELFSAQLLQHSEHDAVDSV